MTTNEGLSLKLDQVLRNQEELKTIGFINNPNPEQIYRT